MENLTVLMARMNKTVSCDSTSYQCYDGSCISKHRRCDTMPNCPGIYQEDENKCLNIVQSSCEEWWLIGARTNGVYFLNDGNEGPQRVYCQFAEKKDKVIISTSIFYTSNSRHEYKVSNLIVTTYNHPDQMIKKILKNGTDSCSQNISITCYFHGYRSVNMGDFTWDCNGRYYGIDRRSFPFRDVFLGSCFCNTSERRYKSIHLHFFQYFKKAEAKNSVINENATNF